MGSKGSALGAALCCAWLCCAGGTVLAQEAINYASVSGRVTDPQGAVVSGATVTARQTATGVSATATTDSAGRFRFPYLRVGPYDLSVTSAGFEPRLEP
jgi:hypothetical protein